MLPESAETAVGASQGAHGARATLNCSANCTHWTLGLLAPQRRLHYSEWTGLTGASRRFPYYEFGLNDDFWNILGAPLDLFQEGASGNLTHLR